jgi:predicted lipid-binding transport protein (Tim44 family)
MRTYTLHLPKGALAGEAYGLDRAQLVPDGFSWRAFAFGPLWFLYHRLWVAALGVTALLVGAAFLGRFLGLNNLSGSAITLLLLVLIGLEASSLRRWTYARRGRPARDAVVAASAIEAERKALARWLEPTSAAPAPHAPYAAPKGRPTDAVIGLFPSSEGRR